MSTCDEDEWIVGVSKGGDALDFYDVVMKRRSVRSFAPTTLPADAVDRVLDAAKMAPSQMNMQPWRFLVLEGQARDRLCSVVSASTRLLKDTFPFIGPEALETAARFLSDLGGAPLVVVVTYPRSTSEYDLKVTLLAVGGAVMLLQSAAAAEGMGSVCITCAEWVEEAIRRDLGFEDERLAAIVPIGYPLGDQGEQPPREEKSVRLSTWPQTKVESSLATRAPGLG